ncbi:MAG: amino acid ABC transporter permease [Candidatus Thermoplasmatota archaeon]|nr:amino acid ABC transporter permease [Candidatus Thermoplasmatota archaeon]MBU1941364.1 amino acid ABC transporter permease [Candidatus Thermoplasmatota archaeon]
MVRKEGNTIVSNFFDFFLASLPKLLEGFGNTLLLTFVSIIFGFLLGVVLAICKIYGNRLISGISIGYIEIIRGTPLIVQLFILYFGLPRIGIALSPIVAALVGLSLNSGAYQAEYLRGAIQSIESGQMVAARSIGMSKFQSIQNIILPQALRISIPAWSNELIYLLKYTSIAYIISVKELTAEGKFIAADTYRYLEIFAMIAIIYLITTIIFTEVIDQIEKRVHIPGIGQYKKRGMRNAM